MSHDTKTILHQRSSQAQDHVPEAHEGTPAADIVVGHFFALGKERLKHHPCHGVVYKLQSKPLRQKRGPRTGGIRATKPLRGGIAYNQEAPTRRLASHEGAIGPKLSYLAVVHARQPYGHMALLPEPRQSYDPHARIAHGIPVGGDLEYADEVTLLKAMDGRREL